MSWVLACKAWELQVWSMSSPGTHIPTWRVQKPEHKSLPHTVRDNWGERKAKNERKSAALELPVLWGLQKVGVNVSGVKSEQRFTTSVARAQPCGVLLHDLCNIHGHVQTCFLLLNYQVFPSTRAGTVQEYTLLPS